METETIHQLTAAYALDALTPEEATGYEEHLARCERCRADLAAFVETTAALAHAGDATPPPAALRERILDQVRLERSNVRPLRARWAVPAAAAAVAAAAAAIVLAVWATSLSRSLDRERAARGSEVTLAEVVSDPQSKRLELVNASGAVFVAPSEDAALVVSKLRPARSGRAYEAWVIPAGGKPRPAAIFRAGRGAAIVSLGRHVGDGMQVAVTDEPAGGSKQPTGRILFHT